MQEQAIQKIRETLDKARQVFGREFPMPKVTFDLRGATAGLFYPGKNLIRLNFALMYQNKDAFLNRTPPHEAAHLITRSIYGRVKPHGPEWRSVMVRLGLPPIRCHSFDVSTVKRKRNGQTFSYFCGCKEHKISVIKHRRAVSGKYTYSCKLCKGRLMPMAPALSLTSRGTGNTSFQID